MHRMLSSQKSTILRPLLIVWLALPYGPKRFFFYAFVASVCVGINHYDFAVVFG